MLRFSLLAAIGCLAQDLGQDYLDKTTYSEAYEGPDRIPMIEKVEDFYGKGLGAINGLTLKNSYHHLLDHPELLISFMFINSKNSNSTCMVVRFCLC